MKQSAQSAHGRKRRRISVGGVALVLAFLFCIAGLWIVWQWNRKPACWREHDRLKQMPVETVERMADRIENRMLSEVSQVGRNGDTATIVLPFEDVNAWLMMKLDDWAANQEIVIPKPLGDFVVASRGDRPVVAFALETEEVSQVFSVTFDVRLPAPGKLVVQIDSVHAGRLPIPVDAVLKHLRKSVPQHVLEPLEKLAEGEPFEAVVDHPGNAAKCLRVVGLDVADKGVAIALKAEPR